MTYLEGAMLLYLVLTLKGIFQAAIKKRYGGMAGAKPNTPQLFKPVYIFNVSSRATILFTLFSYG